MKDAELEQTSGSGFFPPLDHEGRAFADRRRASLAGNPLASGFIGVLDGIEGDQDFIRLTFQLSRFASCQRVCYYCRVGYLKSTAVH